MRTQTPVDTLTTMSIAARAALKREGFTTLESAAMQTDEYLLGIENFGEGSLKRLREWEAQQPQEDQSEGYDVDFHPDFDIGRLMAVQMEEMAVHRRFILASELAVAVARNKGKAGTSIAHEAWECAGVLVELAYGKPEEPQPASGFEDMEVYGEPA